MQAANPSQLTVDGLSVVNGKKYEYVIGINSAAEVLRRQALLYQWLRAWSEAI